MLAYGGQHGVLEPAPLVALHQENSAERAMSFRQAAFLGNRKLDDIAR
jgi:hypothetical protein